MANYICPSCGAVFNGKRCRQCCYENFDEEIGHRLHVHKGEPLVVTESEKRPRAKRDPLSWDRRTRQRKLPKGVLWLLLILFLNPLLSLGFLLVENIAETVADVSVAVAEPVPVYPEAMENAALSPSAELLWESGDFTVWADWGRRTGDDTIPLMVENRTDREVIASARQIVVNDFLTEESWLYCQVASRKETKTDFTMAEGTLGFALEELQRAGISQIEEVAFDIVIYDAESYETIVEAEGLRISLPEPVMLEAGEAVALGGEVFLEGENFYGCYLGYESGWDAESFADGSLLFYLENNTDREITIYTEEATLNGEEVFLSIWCELPAHTRTLTRMYLFGAEEIGVKRPEQAEELWMKNIVLDAWEDGAGVEMEYTVRFR